MPKPQLTYKEHSRLRERDCLKKCDNANSLPFLVSVVDIEMQRVCTQVHPKLIKSDANATSRSMLTRMRACTAQEHAKHPPNFEFALVSLASFPLMIKQKVD